MKSILRHGLALVAILFIALAPANAIINQSGDGMSDVWKAKYGLSITDDGTLDPSQAPGADPDGDGWTNLEESIAGTDPRSGVAPDGLLQLTITHDPAVPSVFVVNWPTIQGKQYQLQVSHDLATWTPIDDPSIGDGTPIQIAIEAVLEDDTQPPKLFWRVSVSDIDSDGDGLTDYEEWVLGSNPYAADSDGNGTNDLTQLLGGTNPMAGFTDTDGDGVADADEDRLGTSKTGHAVYTDSDGDGVMDAYDAIPWDAGAKWPATREVRYAIIPLGVPSGTGGLPIGRPAFGSASFGPFDVFPNPVDPEGAAETVWINGVGAGGHVLATHDNRTHLDGFAQAANGFQNFIWSPGTGTWAALPIDPAHQMASIATAIAADGTTASGPARVPLVDADGNACSFPSLSEAVATWAISGGTVSPASRAWSFIPDNSVLDASFYQVGASFTDDHSSETDWNSQQFFPTDTGAAITSSALDHAGPPISRSWVANRGSVSLWSSNIPPDSPMIAAVSREGDAILRKADGTQELRLNDGTIVALPDQSTLGGITGLAVVDRYPSHPGQPVIMTTGGLWIQDGSTWRALAAQPGGLVLTGAAINRQGVILTSDGKGLIRNGLLKPIEEMVGDVRDWKELEMLQLNDDGTLPGSAYNKATSKREPVMLVPVYAQGIDPGSPSPLSQDDPAAGVDNVSMRAKGGSAVQRAIWIMAPVVSTAHPDMNNFLFASGASATMNLKFGFPGYETQMTVGAPATTPISQPTASGTGTGVSRDAPVVFQVGLGSHWTDAASAPVKVKMMKQRTVKVTVHPMPLKKGGAAAIYPAYFPSSTPTERTASKAMLEAYLNKVYGRQVNTFFNVTVLDPVESDFDDEGPGHVAGVIAIADSPTPEQIKVCIDPRAPSVTANIDIWITGGVEMHEGSELVTSPVRFGRQLGEEFEGKVILDGTLTQLPTGLDGQQFFLHAAAHEIGHVMIGAGHPDEADLPGRASLSGADTDLRLMHSGHDYHALNSQLVKTEWDWIERWLRKREDAGEL